MLFSLDSLVFVGRVVTVILAASFLGRLVHGRMKGLIDVRNTYEKWLLAFHVSVSITALVSVTLNIIAHTQPTIGSVGLIGYPISFIFANIYLNKRLEDK